MAAFASSGSLPTVLERQFSKRTSLTATNVHLLDHTAEESIRAFAAIQRHPTISAAIVSLFERYADNASLSLSARSITRDSFVAAFGGERRTNTWALMQWIFCANNPGATLGYQSFVGFFVQYLLQAALESGTEEAVDNDSFDSVVAQVGAKCGEIAALIAAPRDISRETACELLQLTPSQWGTLVSTVEGGGAAVAVAVVAEGGGISEADVAQRLAESEQQWRAALAADRAAASSLVDAMQPPFADGHGTDRFWTPCSESLPHSLVDVPLTSVEGGFLVQRFLATLPHMRVKKIARNQNILLWHQFASYRWAAEHTLAPSTATPSTGTTPFVAPPLVATPQNSSTEFLFHGCDEKFVPTILREGVDFRLAKDTGVYGVGAYFARDAVYSDRYVRPLPGKMPAAAAAPPPPPAAHTSANPLWGQTPCVLCASSSHPASQHRCPTCTQLGHRARACPTTAGGRQAAFGGPPQAPAAFGWGGGGGGGQAHPQCERIMFICRVAVGSAAIAQPGQARGLRRAPDGFDSVVSTDGRIYAVFSNAASYPEYVVTYERDPAALPRPSRGAWGVAPGFPQPAPVFGALNPYGPAAPTGAFGCIASPVPAIFGAYTGSRGQKYLESADLLAAASSADACALIAALGGSLADSPQCRAKPLLDAQACKILTRYADEQHATRSAPHADLRLEMRKEELASLIGADAFKRAAAFLSGRFDTIKLRRAVGAVQGPTVGFHTDFSKRTMQIALNDESEYDGGRLVFATAEGFVKPARPRGSVTVHVNSIVHGVTALTSGVRYGLFFCDTKGHGTNGLLDYLLEPSMSQFSFFQDAIDVLDAATDDDLAALSKRYARFMRSAGRTNAAPPSFEIELAWRTHLLHPLVYARACGQGSLLDHSVDDDAQYPSDSRGSGAASEDEEADDAAPALGLDLVAAMRRQQKFMRAMLAERSRYERTEVVSDAIAEYRDFLERVKHSAVPLEPTPIVDLVWHTHQQFPARYAVECRRIAGSFMDHSD